MLNKTGTKTEPWGTAVVTGHQLDLGLWTNTHLTKNSASWRHVVVTELFLLLFPLMAKVCSSLRLHKRGHIPRYKI